MDPQVRSVEIAVIAVYARSADQQLMITLIAQAAFCLNVTVVASSRSGVRSRSVNDLLDSHGRQHIHERRDSTHSAVKSGHW